MSVVDNTHPESEVGMTLDCSYVVEPLRFLGLGSKIKKKKKRFLGNQTNQKTQNVRLEEDF